MQIATSRYELLKSAHDRLEGEYRALQDERNRQHELLAQIRSLQENLEHAGSGEKTRLVCPHAMSGPYLRVCWSQSKDTLAIPVTRPTARAG